MHVVLSVLVVGVLIVAWAMLCKRVAGWHAARSKAVRSRGAAPSPADGPGLPAGHRPPPGLGPLSPSERFLTHEAARGLRDLQLFLADQRTV